MLKIISNKFSTSEYNCAQAMIAYVYQVGNKYKQEQPQRYEEYMYLGKAFGGGISGLKESCGFLSGFCMGLALYLDPKDDNFKEITNTFNDNLKVIASSNNCETITNGLALSSPQRKGNCVNILNQILISIDKPLNDYFRGVL